jgi:hypothetical protein
MIKIGLPARMPVHGAKAVRCTEQQASLRIQHVVRYIYKVYEDIVLLGRCQH